MIFLAFEILILATAAFAGGVLAGRVAYAVSTRAAAASKRGADSVPELDPEADIEEIYALFDPTDEPAGSAEAETIQNMIDPEAERIPEPAPPAQVKFERLLKQARDSQKKQRDEPNS